MFTIENFNYLWIATAIITFFYLLKYKTAPYGRHSSANWGPQISNRLGWILMELPALVFFLYFYFTNKIYTNNVVLFFIVLWAIHYLNRSLIFPFRIKTNGKKMPIIIMLSAILFNTVNTFLIAYFLAKNPELYGADWFTSWQFMAGLTLFVLGFGINQYTDYQLINLRLPGETHYKIPTGFWFNLVSCPNLLGEIIEWLGFAIMLWCLPAFTFFIWTFANLVPRAISHHKWYQAKFENYPKQRKAVFPFLW